MSDPVLSPNHYTAGGIEVIDYLRTKLTPEEFAGFCKGNVIKYLSRANHKNGAEDLKKAAFYARFIAGDDPRKKEPPIAEGVYRNLLHLLQITESQEALGRRVLVEMHGPEVPHTGRYEVVARDAAASMPTETRTANVAPAEPTYTSLDDSTPITMAEVRERLKTIQTSYPDAVILVKDAEYSLQIPAHLDGYLKAGWRQLNENE